MAKKVAVIGAGPAGLTVAWQLMSKGCEVDLYESSGFVGGMARTFELWGQKVDVGPHRFFSKDRRINEFWLKFAGKEYAMVDRLTRIRYGTRFFKYPLELKDVFKNLTALEIMLIGMSYAKEKVIPNFGKQDTFEKWVTRRFGKRLFSMFFRSYTEKLWGIGCDRLDADFATQRIKKLSVGEVLKSFFSKKAQSEHATLVDRFAYPLGGAGQVYERMAEDFVRLGGQLFLSTPVDGLWVDNAEVRGLEIRNRGRLAYDHVVSTMPLTQLVSGLPHLPPEVNGSLGFLRYRSTILVYLQLKRSDYFPDNWIYVHSDDMKTGRITNFRNWVPSINQGREETIIALEYWCYAGDEAWGRADDVLIEQAKHDLVKGGLVPRTDILDGYVLRIPRCYPVYERGYKEQVQVLVDYLRHYKNLTPIGRYGAFKYNNQDHSILMGLLAADLIVDGKGTADDLWAVNTDYGSYHEESRITDTGLA